MNYQEWEASVPQELRGDLLWRMRVYRLALFAGEIGWQDVSKLAGDRRMYGLSDQLWRALGSIGANVAEGYSRSWPKDRARFFEYALGSARESRDWYYKARHLLTAEVVTHRLGVLTQIIRLLLTIIPAERKLAVKENSPTYEAGEHIASVEDPPSMEPLPPEFDISADIPDYQP